MERVAVREMAIVSKIICSFKIFLIIPPMEKIPAGLFGAFPHYSKFYLAEKSSKSKYEILGKKQNKKIKRKLILQNLKIYY